METWRVSTSEALRRRLNAADETPHAIMALGAFLDTFVAGGGCSTELAECRLHDRKGGCFPIKYKPQHTLSWDESTLDTMTASEESSNSRSSRHRSKSRSKSPSSRGKINQALGFLKRRKAEEESSFPTRNRTRSEEKSDSRTVGSELRTVTDQEEPKSIWSTNFLSGSFDQLKNSFSIEQAYGQSIFQNSTMESVENSVKPDGSTTKSRPQPLRRRSTPSPSKAQYSSLTDTLQPQRSFRRNSTPKSVGKKPRLVSPDSTPKAHNSQRRSSSSSPLRSRSLWSLRQSQSQYSPRKSKYAPEEGDSLREWSSCVRSSETWRRQAREGSVFDSGNAWHCPDTQPPTSFWQFDFPNLFCGQGLAGEPSIKTPNSVASTTTFSPNDTGMNDLIMETSPAKTISSASSTFPSKGSPQADTYSQSLVSMEQPLDDSDILAHASIEQTLQDIALEKKNKPFQTIFRTTTGILGKLSGDNKPEGCRLETPPIQTSATHDTDLLAKASVEQSLEESKVLGSAPEVDNPVTKDTPSNNKDNDHSLDPASDQKGNEGVDEIVINAVVEDAPVPVKNDRLGDLEQQVHDLMSRILQMEHENKETTDDGQEDRHDNVVMNTADNMEIQADMQEDQLDDPQLKEQTMDNKSSPDGLVEEKQQPMMNPLVPREEMPPSEQVSIAGNEAEATTTGSKMEDPVNNVQEASVCSTVEENRTDEDCAEDDGIEVDILDFDCKTDRIMNDQDVSTIISMEQEIKVEEKQQPTMHPVVPREEIPPSEQVSVAGNEAEATTTGSKMEDPVNNVQEASVCSTLEENRNDEECAEDDGIEVDLLDFDCKTDRITNDQGVSTIISMEQDIKQDDQDDEGEEGQKIEWEQKLKQDSGDEEEGIEISTHDIEHILNSNDTEQADQSSIQNNAKELAESSNEEVIEKKNKNKKRNIVRGLKKKLQRVTGPRISKSRIKSTMEGQEVMPLTGVYGVQVGSEISSVSTLVSSEGQTAVKQPRGRYGMREKSCEVSLATGATTLPTSNVLRSFND